jgi:hypothetical protein
MNRLIQLNKTTLVLLAIGTFFVPLGHHFAELPPNQPPNCDSAVAEPAQLWPPNHHLVPVTIRGVVDPDGDAFTLTVTGITQDEPVQGHGDGNTAPDGLGAGDETAQIRAERSGQGNGRVYAISFLARDANGLESTGTVKTAVPETRNEAAVDSGQNYDSITAQSRIVFDNSIKVANVNQNENPGHFDVKKTLPFSLTVRSDVFVKYDLGQSHGCCADHHTGALRIQLDGRVALNDAVPFNDYEFIRYLEDFDYFWPPGVVKGQIAPVSNPNCPGCQPPITGPLLRNYKPASSYMPLGVLEAGQHEAKLLLGDAGWNSIFEIWASPTAPPATRLVINVGLFVNDTPTEWLNAASTTLCGRTVQWTSNGITVTGPTGRLPFHATPSVGWVSKYRFIGSNCHLLILDSETGQGPQTRIVSLVDFSTSPPTEKPILNVSSSSELALPNVQWSQGTGDAFFIFAPVPGVQTQAAEIAIHRSDNGQVLCAGPPPFHPDGQLVAEATADQLLIKVGGTPISTCTKP